jgi:cysteine-rich repeat protein
LRALSALSLALLALGGCPLPPPAACGDGALNAGESCDDGNLSDADGCEADCSLPSCGNGIVDPGEVCLVGPVDVATGAGPSSVVVADFDADGALDLATADTGAESLGLLLGDGAGGFSPAPSVPLLGGPFPLAAGDFDADGSLDLAAGLLSGPDEIPVVRGNGLGAFSPLVALSASPGVGSLVAGDFDNDGSLDLAAGDFAGGGVSLYLNSGEGGFIAPRSFAPGLDVSSLAAGDFDNDGALDLAVAASAGDGVVLLGDGSGGFSSLPLQAEGAFSLVVGDFDDDGSLDLVAGVSSLLLLLGDGAGGFSAGSAVEVGAPLALAVDDFNGDELPDIAAGLPFDPIDPVDAHLAILLGDGDGGFSVLPLLPLGISSPLALAVADFNGDGLPDVALADQGNTRVQIFFSAP